MTEEEKKRIRQEKKEVAKFLQKNEKTFLSEYSYALSETDKRLEEYVCLVIDNPDEHNFYELLAVRRFFLLLDRYDWKPKRVKTFFKFYETLKFNGASGRQRYKLTPIQCFQFANIYGFASDDGRRLIRTAYIFVPRKFSKTTSAASVAVYDMFFGDNNAQAFVAANSYEQAKICFDEIRAIVRDIDPRERHFQVNREKITFKIKGRDSFIRCLAANAKTQDGLNASTVIMDEYAQARDTANRSGAELKNVLTSSMGVRREPLIMIISTASDVVDGVFYHEIEGAKAVLRGEIDNDTIFASLFMPDVDDEEDNERTWRKVQPHMGITVQKDFYEKEWLNAQLSAQNKLAFRTKLLNLFVVDEQKTWFTYEKARDLLGEFNIDKLERGTQAAVAFDLSIHDDFSAVAYTVYSSVLRKFFSQIDYYFPSGALKGHPNEILYRTWSEAGHLKLCRGACIDVAQIAGDIISRTNKITIIAIGYDAYKSQELVNSLSAAGAKYVLQPYKQTYGSFNLPVESFEMMAYKEPAAIEFANNPITAFCLANCIIDTDMLDNKKPIKISQYRKIDGIIAFLMTLGQLYSLER